MFLLPCFSPKHADTLAVSRCIEWREVLNLLSRLPLSLFLSRSSRHPRRFCFHSLRSASLTRQTPGAEQVYLITGNVSTYWNSQAATQLVLLSAWQSFSESDVCSVFFPLLYWRSLSLTDLLCYYYVSNGVLAFHCWWIGQVEHIFFRCYYCVRCEWGLSVKGCKWGSFSF